jgi:hypothetical protein
MQILFTRENALSACIYELQTFVADDYPLEIIDTTTANNATASIKAAAINIAVWIFEAASGWRAIASIAEPPILPIPNPAPIAAKPAPIAANVPVIVLNYIVKKNISNN